MGSNVQREGLAVIAIDYHNLVTLHCKQLMVII